LITADDGVTGRELWKSDGTTAGTVLVKDINPGPDHSLPRRPANPERVISAQLTAVDDTVIFRAFDPAHGLEPWVSDGTSGGTILVDDINRGLGDSLPEGTPGRFTERRRHRSLRRQRRLYGNASVRAVQHGALDDGAADPIGESAQAVVDRGGERRELRPSKSQFAPAPASWKRLPPRIGTTSLTTDMRRLDSRTGL
jgi:ELWxxDGT repeat protein